MALRALIRVALSLLCAGIFYAAWLVAFLLTAEAGSSFAHVIRWLSASVATAAGFATGLLVSERLTGTRKAPFLRILPWPLVGCAVGAGAVYRFGPMLIVFGMFAAGTASVVIREVVLHTMSSRSGPRMKEKIALDPDKRTWHPSPLAGQIVLVTTLNQDGTSNLAPKSWVSMMAFEPPILALGCNLKHWTAQNILARREFVVNVPGAELVATVWKGSELPHPRPVEAMGLTPMPAAKVKPPRIIECKAHLECTLDRHLAYGDEAVLFGRIVAVSVDKKVCEVQDPYKYLRMLVYLDGKAYGVIERARQVGQPEI